MADRASSGARRRRKQDSAPAGDSGQALPESSAARYLDFWQKNMAAMAMDPKILPVDVWSATAVNLARDWIRKGTEAGDLPPTATTSGDKTGDSGEP